MVRKVCRGIKEGGLCPVDSETNRENFLSQPKKIRYFSTFSNSFLFVLPKKSRTPVHLKITFLNI